MKRFGLLPAALLTLALMAGCGADNTGSGKVSSNDTLDNSVNDTINGVERGTEDVINGVERGVDDTLDAGRNAVNGTKSGTTNYNDSQHNTTTTQRNTTTGTATTQRSTTTGTATTQRSNQLLRGASYEQMLRNARVHDRDGDLTDGENAMTPGTGY